MRIQHNIMAMSAYRNYTNNVSAMKKNLEKLSSGYKINRAGDDAAGLAISEKMRAQITGLETAQKNAKDGISLVQTAEGALTEVHDMLNRMVELATQSANGTYDDTTDRAQLQKEVNQLKDEINRIADSANFNGIKLLDGSLSVDKTTVPGKAQMILGTPVAGNFINQSTSPAVGTAALPSTVLHKDAAGAGATKFEVTLNGLSMNPVTAGTAAIVTVTVGGVGITAAVGADGKDSYDAAQLASALGTANTTVEIGGVDYDITVNGDHLVFTMNNASAQSATKAASFTGNFAVDVGVETGKGKLTNNGNVNLGTVNVVEGSPNSGTILANTVQATAWSNTDFTDGKVLKVGEEAYILAMTDDTYGKALSVANTVQADGLNYKVVDLRDLVDPAVTGTPRLVNNTETTSNALARITVAAKDNKMFSVGLDVDTGLKLTFQEKADYKPNGGTADLSKLDSLTKQFAVYSSATFDVQSATSTVEGKPLTLQIGDTAESFNQLKVDVKDCHTASLGIADLNIGNQIDAAAAVDKIKAAINTVSDVRGTLGATQNRLDHTINNLSVMTENIQDAESTIRDVDVAEEMMAYTKNNILIQSAQAMLAQANQVPQGVLQLLQ